MLCHNFIWLCTSCPSSNLPYIDVNECSNSSLHYCQQVCVNSAGSFSCSCNSGYSLNSDRRTCTGKTVLQQEKNTITIFLYLSFCVLEIHECNEMADNCEQICHNTNGSFHCSCQSGYTLSTNGHSCTSKYYVLHSLVT